MRSRLDTGLGAGLAVLVLGAAMSLWAAQRAPKDSLPAAGRAPSREQIALALDKVKADPNLSTQHTLRTLRWVESTDEVDKQSRTPGWILWMRGLFGWFAQSARILIWVAFAVVIGLLVLYVVRVVRERGLVSGDGRFVAPTHVRDLDIRPQSLPPDIGAAAYSLWEKGEHRAALALLYRGLLSRLANVHGVPIRHSSTEGDCLALTALHVSEDRSAYATRLVRTWQRAVYGGADPAAAAVRALCDGFAAALDAPVVIDDARGGKVARQTA